MQENKSQHTTTSTISLDIRHAFEEQGWDVQGCYHTWQSPE